MLLGLVAANSLFALSRSMSKLDLFARSPAHGFVGGFSKQLDLSRNSFSTAFGGLKSKLCFIPLSTLDLTLLLLITLLVSPLLNDDVSDNMLCVIASRF